ncbi:MAG: zinc ABC transporter substrate-binding protein [Bacteroidota bacterium]
MFLSLRRSLWVVPLLLFPFLLPAQEPPIRIVATTTFLADMTQQIVGNELSVVSLMPLGGDPHIYEPIPGDAKLIAEADLILKNGLTLEGWLNEMIENSGTQAKVATVSEGISPIQSSDHVGAVDPHAWMDVQYALKYCRNILAALREVAPEMAPQFEQNFAAYEAELQALDQYILAQIKRIPPSQRILATSHDAFRYFGNRYGLEVVSILGTSTDAEIRLEDIQVMKDLIRDRDLPTLFIESTINPQTMQQIAEDERVRIGKKLFADSLGDEESGADSFTSMLRQNTDRIVEGLLLGKAEDPAQQEYVFLWVVAALFVVAFWVVKSRLQLPVKEGLPWQDYQIEVEGLSVSYDRKMALSNVYLQIEPGYVYGLIGGNGSGKSTLFKSILGLIDPDAGSVRIHGQAVDDVRKFITYIPQQEEIDWSFPATVLDVVMMGRYPHHPVFGRLDEADRHKAVQALKALGIEELQQKQIGELSGGQQQRVFIARAMCQEAEVYLFDEPFVGVDMATEHQIMDIVRSLATQGKLVVIIHHDLAKVKEYFDRLIMINQRVIAVGETETVFTDENIKHTYGGRLTILQKTEHYL